MALVSKAREESSQKEKAGKKKKVLIAHSDEVDMKTIMKSLALITKEYNKGFRRPSYRDQYERENRERIFDRKPEEEREERRDEKRSHQRSDGGGGERSEGRGDKNDAVSNVATWPLCLLVLLKRLKV